MRLCIYNCVGICTKRNLIIPFFQHICFCIVVIVRRHVFFCKCDCYCFTCSWLQKLCLLKSDQIYRSFLNSTICIRWIVVNLHNIFSCYITCVGNSYVNRDCAVIYLQLSHFLLKGCVGKSISKWILYHFVVVKQSFLCGSLIEAISYIDSVCVVYKIRYKTIHFKFIHVVICKESEVIVCRCLCQIFYKCVTCFCRRIGFPF